MRIQKCAYKKCHFIAIFTQNPRLHPLKSKFTPLFPDGFGHFLHLGVSIIIYAPTQKRGRVQFNGLPRFYSLQPFSTS